MGLELTFQSTVITAFQSESRFPSLLTSSPYGLCTSGGNFGHRIFLCPKLSNLLSDPWVMVKMISVVNENSETALFWLLFFTKSKVLFIPCVTFSEAYDG